jgi:hypothetical protein
MKDNKKLNKNGVLADHETQRLNRLRKRKECFGCGDRFTTYKRTDYDYCLSCAINNTRYISGRFKPNLCAECGDGSG